MNSKTRIKKAIDHEETDKLPVDFGGTLVTCIHVSTLYKLRQHYKLDKPGTPVKLTEPFWGTGEVGSDLGEILGTDVKKLDGIKARQIGIKKIDWKEWKLDDGTPVLVPGKFNTEKNPDGRLYQYPLGNKSAEPSSVMPKNGYYFDAINRQKPIDHNNLDVKDNIEEFKVIPDDEIQYMKKKADDYFNNSEYAIFLDHCVSGFGDISVVPGVGLKNPKGVRDITDWLILTATDKNYIKKIFEYQCEIAIKTYSKIYAAIGDKIDAGIFSGTDFGTQYSQICSVEDYKELYKPYNKKINDWVHENTSWKTFIHTDGAIYNLIPEFIDAGFDILNPVQVSAANMEPEKLKKEYGKYITFWGGSIDPQKVLPFGTPTEVKENLKRNIEIFSKNGGYVFANIHCLQANIPIENLAAMIETVNRYR